MSDPVRGPLTRAAKGLLGTWWAVDTSDNSLEQLTFGAGGATGQRIGPLFVQFTLNPDGTLVGSLGPDVFMRARPS